jgi:hypothetical protein
MCHGGRQKPPAKQVRSLVAQLTATPPWSFFANVRRRRSDAVTDTVALWLYYHWDIERLKRFSDDGGVPHTFFLKLAQ